MATPFGFSVGDFLAAIELTIRIGKALKESGGATAEYRQLHQDLVLLRQVLEVLQRLQPAGFSPSRINAIKGMALTCLVPLTEFAKKLDKIYASSLGTGSSAHILKRGSKKVRRALLSADEVTNFRAVISAKVVSTTLLLGVCNSEAISSVHETSRKTQDFLRDHAVQDEQNLDNKFSDLSVNVTRNHDDLLARVVQLREGLKTDVSSVKEMQNHQHRLLVQKVDAQHEATNILTTRLTENFRKADFHYTRLIGVCSGIRSANRQVLAIAQSESLQMKREIRLIAANQREAEVRLPSAYQPLLTQVKMLQTLGESVLSLLIPFSQKVLDYLQQNMAKNLEIFTILLRLEASLPRAINQGGADTIFFEDVLGRTKQLPYAYFRHWEVFESMLRCEFRGLPGEGKVLDGQYFLLNGPLDGMQVDKNSWEQTVFPNVRLRMSVEIIRWGASWETVYCPRCRHIFQRHHPMETTLYQCTICQIVFFAQAMPERRLLMGLPGIEKDDTYAFSIMKSRTLRSYFTGGPVQPTHPTSNGASTAESRSIAITMSSLEAKDISVFRSVHLKDASMAGTELILAEYKSSGEEKVFNCATTEIEDRNLERYLRAVLDDDSFVTKSPTACVAAYTTLFRKSKYEVTDLGAKVAFLEALYDDICAAISGHVQDLMADIKRWLRSGDQSTGSDLSQSMIHEIWPVFQKRVGLISRLSTRLESSRYDGMTDESTDRLTDRLTDKDFPKPCPSRYQPILDKSSILQHAYLEMLSLVEDLNLKSLRHLIMESLTALEPTEKPELMELYETTYKPTYRSKFQKW